VPISAHPQHDAALFDLPEDEAREIAVEAWLYAYPLVLMEITRRVMTNVAVPDGSGKAPMNWFGHKRTFPDASFTDVVSPNADTLYSMMFFDVSKEPLIIEAPSAGARYYLLQHMDMWSDVFASPGTRTTGNGALRYALTGPNWSGPPRRGVPEIRSPTNRGWIIGRTQTNGVDDYLSVHAFQDGITSTPYSQYGLKYLPEEAPFNSALDMSAPVDQVAKMDATTFFTFFSRLVRAERPHDNDQPVHARMARIGIEIGQTFDASVLSPPLKAAIDAASAAAMDKIGDHLRRTARIVNGWEIVGSPVGTYGADYLRRAAVAYSGLGANVPEDAIYPTIHADADGNPLDSAARYVLHFDKGQLPPARAFWSLTIYNERHFFAANPVNRYAIGDRDKLRMNEDGSLDIVIQRERPANVTNWLPAPLVGPFSLTMRIYWPKAEVADGSWSPPPLIKQAQERAS
jgi:hypothetical protein